MPEKVVIGNAELWHGDCLEVLPLLPQFDLALTDPPYGTGGWRRDASGAGSNPAAKLVREQWDDGALEWLRLCRGVPVLTFWPAAHMPELMGAAVACGYDKVRMLYMRKLDPKPQVGGRVSWAVETIVALGNEGFQLYGGTDWCEASTPRLNRDADATGHPYQKPLQVMQWALDKTKAPAVVDPYMGSGTTGVAAVLAGRQFFGVEQERRYFDMACERIARAQAQGSLLVEVKAAVPQQTMLELP